MASSACLGIGRSLVRMAPATTTRNRLICSVRLIDGTYRATSRQQRWSLGRCSIFQRQLVSSHCSQECRLPRLPFRLLDAYCNKTQNHPVLLQQSCHYPLSVLRWFIGCIPFLNTRPCRYCVCYCAAVTTRSLFFISSDARPSRVTAAVTPQPACCSSLHRIHIATRTVSYGLWSVLFRFVASIFRDTAMVAKQSREQQL